MMNKILIKNILVLSSALTLITLITGCEGDVYCEEDTVPIVANVSSKAIPLCLADKNDANSSILVASGERITNLEPDTTIRIWHYLNSEERVCVLTGVAVIE